MMIMLLIIAGLLFIAIAFEMLIIYLMVGKTKDGPIVLPSISFSKPKRKAIANDDQKEWRRENR